MIVLDLDQDNYPTSPLFRLWRKGEKGCGARLRRRGALAITRQKRRSWSNPARDLSAACISWNTCFARLRKKNQDRLVLSPANFPQCHHSRVNPSGCAEQVSFDRPGTLSLMRRSLHHFRHRFLPIADSASRHAAPTSSEP